MRAALEGLPGVTEAEVDLQTEMATVRARGGLAADDAVEAVRSKVLLSWARGLLARAPFLGRRPP